MNIIRDIFDFGLGLR